MAYKDIAKKREYQNKWKAQRRLDWIVSQNSTCVECGNVDGPWEVDHVDPSTKVSSAIWSWSKVRMAEELEKCQLLCKSCHREKTNKELSGWKHGSTGYKYGCRCETCVSEAARQRNASRARKAQS